MPIAKIANTEMYYELRGEGEPLILIAGYGCDHTFWLAMFQALKTHFNVLMFDNRGVGRTHDSGEAFTIEMMAQEIVALWQQLGLSRPHMVGQSMGGAIVQTIARDYPDAINKICILNSSAKFSERTLMALASHLTLRKRHVPLETLVDTALPWFFSSDFLAKRENVALFKEAVIYNPYPQSLADQERQYNLLPPFNSRGWLKEIKAPTLIIAAKDDIVSPIADSEEIASLIQQAELHIIPGGHSSPVEHPDVINEILLNFLRKGNT